MYNKLFTKILDSSIWLAPDPQRLVWITLIAAMNKHGEAEFACAENLAARARVTLEETREAIRAFESPDPYGLEQEYEGRRIERIEGGWLILNAEKYAKLVTSAVAAEQSRLRMQKKRERDKMLRNVTPLRPALRAVTPSDHTQIRSDQSKSEEKKTATRLPENFSLTVDRINYATKHGLEPGMVLENFCDWWKQANGPNSLKRDWDAAWRTWCRKEAERPTSRAKVKPRFLTTDELIAKARAEGRNVD